MQVTGAMRLESSVRRRRENGVDSATTASLDILCQSAGVPVVVLARPELQRIHESGDDDLTAGTHPVPRYVDQRQVALMQSTHCHYDGALRAPRVAESCSNVSEHIRHG